MKILFLLYKKCLNKLQIIKKKTGCLSTKKLMNLVKKNNEIFKGDNHQDCHEFCIWLLNELNDILKKKSNFFI